jgi:DNA-3-methyladenine glycosylase II
MLTAKRLKTYEKSSYLYRNGAFLRTIRGKKGPLLMEVSEDQETSALAVTLTGEISPEDQADLPKRIAFMFGTQLDLRPFYEQMEQDDVLRPVIEARQGMRMVLEPSVYECLMKTIIGQQLNVSFAAVLLKRFLSLAGEECEFAGEKWLVFPTPEQVVRLRYEDLQQLQFNRRKAEYLIDISRMIVDRKLDLESLIDKPDEEVIQTLTALRGVGRWTAECVLMFGFGRLDLLPAADIGLRNAIWRLGICKERPSEMEVRKIGEKWSPYRSYATFYLWDTLDNMKEKPET